MEPSDEQKKIQTVVEDFITRLGISGSTTTAVDEVGSYRVHIESDETGLLIGHHGKTIESIQLLLNMVVARELGVWKKVYVNVGDYREKREETLMLMAQRAADRAIALGRPVELARLSPSERRVVHLTLTGDDRVVTESVGEGDDRVLLVKPKTA